MGAKCLQSLDWLRTLLARRAYRVLLTFLRSATRRRCTMGRASCGSGSKRIQQALYLRAKAPSSKPADTRQRPTAGAATPEFACTRHMRWHDCPHDVTVAAGGIYPDGSHGPNATYEPEDRRNPERRQGRRDFPNRGKGKGKGKGKGTPVLQYSLIRRLSAQNVSARCTWRSVVHIRPLRCTFLEMPGAPRRRII